jgi:tetratricopeptide (TPR) repeat protein
MAILASILNRCTTLAQKSLGKRLMISACELGERSATYELVASALRTGNLKEYDGSIRRLAMLANKENDPRAMLLLGKALYGQGGNRESLSWFQKATRPPTGSLNFDGAAEALVQEGRILLSRNEALAARDAFSKAAFELDDPTAYFYLSQFEDTGSKEQEVYLMKASTAGITEAWHNLGSLELAKDTKRIIKKMEDYGVAREWFLVAASEGFGLSMLNLAVMHKAVGEIEEGLEWLERAEETEGVEEEARRLKSEWVDGVAGVEEFQGAENETYIPK